MNLKKGRNNKLNIDDKVQLTPRIVKWYVEHINENYLNASRKELNDESKRDAAGWYHAYFTQQMPIGKVVGYGCSAYGPTKKSPETWVELKDQRCVKLVVKLKYGNYGSYFHERDMKKVK